MMFLPAACLLATALAGLAVSALAGRWQAGGGRGAPGPAPRAPFRPRVIEGGRAGPPRRAMRQFASDWNHVTLGLRRS